MNFQNSIILTFNNIKSRKGKFVIDRDCIIGMFTGTERDFHTQTDKEVTYIRVTFDTAEKLGIDNKYLYRDQRYLDIAIEENLIIVFGLVKGSKGVEVLYGNKG